MQNESPRNRFKKLRDEHSRTLRQLRIQLGESLLRSHGSMLPETKADRERIAQIEAYKHLISSTIRELENWRQFKDRAANRGMLKQVKFRQQMIAEMEDQLDRYKEELRRLRSIPGSFWTGST